MKSLISRFFDFYYEKTIEGHILFLEAEEARLEKELEEIKKELAEARQLRK